jgi:AAA domain
MTTNCNNGDLAWDDDGDPIRFVERLERENGRPAKSTAAAIQARSAAKCGDIKGRFNWLSAADLDDAEFEQQFIVPGILAEGQPGGVYGSFKTLKTSTVMDLLLSVSTGSKFLNHFAITAPMPTAFMSGESGMKNLQSIARRICHSRGWSLGTVENFHITSVLPRLEDPTDLAEIGRFIKKHGIKVLAIDPAYLCMRIGDDAHNLFLVGQFLKPLGELSEATGCTPLIVHHNKRNVGHSTTAPAELSDIAWSGFAEFSAQWILLSRRSPFDAETGRHELWMGVGGRDGHCGLYGVDVKEGRHDDDRGRIWDPSVRKASETRAVAAVADAQMRETTRDDKRKKQEAIRDSNDREKVLNALRAFPDGESKRTLGAMAKLNPDRLTRALQALLDEKVAVPCSFKKSRQTVEGFKLAATDGVGQMGQGVTVPAVATMEMQGGCDRTLIKRVPVAPTADPLGSPIGCHGSNERQPGDEPDEQAPP